MKKYISESDFRQALDIHDHFEWPDGDFELWIVWETMRELACDHFGVDRMVACETSGKIGNDITDEAWRRGMSIARRQASKRINPVIAAQRRLAYRVRHAP